MSVLNQVFGKVDALWDEEVDFLQKLGSYPSTLGNEAPVQRFIQRTFEKMELETDAFIPDGQTLAALPGYSHAEWSYDGRPIVVGKWAVEGPKTGKSIILQGHIDVVSPEPLRLWDYDPWGSTIVGDRMYGRGICDMKAGVAAFIYAVKAIQVSGIELGADVLLQTVYEEEVTGNGALATLERGYTADGGLIPEPFGPAGVTAQVGVILMRVRVTGGGGHVLSADQSVNAIEKAIVLINMLRDYQKEINYEQPKHKDFEHMDHPLNVNVGVMQSGDWVSNVPADCMFEVRVGLYPGQDPQAVKDDLKDRIMEAAAKDSWLKDMPPEVTFYGHHAHGVTLDKNLDIFTYLVKAHNNVYDQPMEYISITATTDIQLYNLYYDIPMTCYGPDGGNIHGPNEWVDLPSVKKLTKAYAAFMLDWCGVKNSLHGM